MKNAQNSTTNRFGGGLEKSSFRNSLFVNFVGNFTDDSAWPQCATILIPLGKHGRLFVRGLSSLCAGLAMITRQLKM